VSDFCEGEKSQTLSLADRPGVITTVGAGSSSEGVLGRKNPFVWSGDVPITLPPMDAHGVVRERNVWNARALAQRGMRAYRLAWLLLLDTILF
jgi:hypothetical protein